MYEVLTVLAKLHEYLSKQVSPSVVDIAAVPGVNTPGCRACLMFRSHLIHLHDALVQQPKLFLQFRNLVLEMQKYAMVEPVEPTIQGPDVFIDASMLA